MRFFKIKNISLDSYETNNLVKSSFGTKSNDHIEDNLIKSRFDFLRCYEEALRKDEYGFFLIITGKQYIFSRCYDEGEQGHMLSVAKTFLELDGKDSDISVIQSSKIYNEYVKKFLVFELEIKTQPVGRKRDKYFRGNINRETISNEEYQLFKKFLDEYENVIDKCKFEYSIWDKISGKIMPIENFIHFDMFLSSIVNENTKPQELENEEKIVGITLEKDENKQVLR